MSDERMIHGISTDLPCRISEEWLHFYLEGEADSFLSRQVAAHLSRCPSCSEKLRHLEEERRELLERAMLTPALSSHFPARVAAEIRRLEAHERELRIRGRLRRLGIAGLVVLAASVWVVLDRALELPPSPPRGGRWRAPAGTELVSPTPSSTSSTASPTAHSAAASSAGRKAPPPTVRLVSLPVRVRLKLADSIEYSASIFRLEARPACNGDVNDDGETNASDAAHLFMLAVAPPPEGLAPTDDPSLDCSSPCQI